MTIDSSEIPHEQAEVGPKPPRGKPIGDKLITGGAKIGVKGVIGAARLTKNVLSPPTRLVGRNIWGAKWGLTAAAGSIGLGYGAVHPAETRNYTKNLVTNPVSVLRPAVPAAKDALLDAVDTAISKLRDPSLEINKNSGENDLDLKATANLYWPGATEADRQKIETNVSVMHAYYVGTKDQPPLLPPETYSILKSKIGLIEKSCIKTPWLVNPVVGLAIAESRGGVDGNLENMTESGALGPFMMTEGFIRDHGYEPTGDKNDPGLSWEITVPIVVKELKERTEHFGGNLGLAVWSWHRGVQAVDDDLIQLAQQRGWSTDVSVAQLVRDNNVTEFDLEEDSVIQEELKLRTQNSTVIFVLRNAAGALVWVHVHQLEEKIKLDEQQRLATKAIELPQQEHDKAA